MRKKYVFQPMAHAQSTDYASSLVPVTHMGWGAKNLIINQHSSRKRWGYDEDRDLGNAVIPYDVVLYVLKGGTRYTVYLTDGDLCSKETASGKTFKYRTEEYADGNVSDISTVTVTGSGTTWVTAMVDDYFVLDEDLTDDVEPDASWRKISAASTTSLTLSAAYQKDISGQTKSYHIRRVYTVPSNERWSWAIVGDKFIFTNGDTTCGYWDGGASTYAVTLEATPSVAKKARYCIEYANRLFIADYGATRDPLGLAWSKENDPTDWTDTSAGAAQLFETDNYITGLGKSGASLIIFRQDSIMIGNRTGVSASPVTFPRHRGGVGCVAPWSIVPIMGTSVFLGRDDFYIMRADYPESIGEKIRDKFFDIVDWTEVEKTWGFLNMLTNEVTWLANTSEGQLAFVYNYKTKDWYVNSFANSIAGAGRGAK